ATDFPRVHVERCGDFDVGDVIAADGGVHEPGDRLVARRIRVVRQALDERRRAVAYADDCDTDFTVQATHLRSIERPFRGDSRWAATRHSASKGFRSVGGTSMASFLRADP